MKRFSVAGVVPAAGASKRMGVDKRRLKFGDSTVLESTIRNLVQGGCSPVYVVLEPDSPCFELAIFNHPEVRRVVLRENSQSMLQTICTAIPVASGADAIAILPGDCALISPSVVARLVDYVSRERSLLLVPIWQGAQGHPRFVSKQAFQDVFRLLEKSTKFSDLFRLRHKDVTFVEIDDPLLVIDIDTPADYKSAIARLEKS